MIEAARLGMSAATSVRHVGSFKPAARIVPFAPFGKRVQRHGNPVPPTIRSPRTGESAAVSPFFDPSRSPVLTHAGIPEETISMVPFEETLSFESTPDAE